MNNLNTLGLPVKWKPVGMIMEAILSTRDVELPFYYGRITGVDKDSAKDPDGSGIHAQILCSTPHGTVYKIGISNIEEIIEQEDFDKLKEFEEDSMRVNEEIYNNELKSILKW